MSKMTSRIHQRPQQCSEALNRLARAELLSKLLMSSLRGSYSTKEPLTETQVFAIGRLYELIKSGRDDVIELLESSRPRPFF